MRRSFFVEEEKQGELIGEIHGYKVYVVYAQEEPDQEETMALYRYIKANTWYRDLMGRARNAEYGGVEDAACDVGPT